MSKIVIPEALQIVIDDLGWFCGDDDRKSGGSSRSGMPRRHNHLDYECIDTLGRAIGQKIFCAFVVGEWDADNRLKNVPHLSKYGKNWDNAKYLDQNEMQKVVDAVNNAEYIDLALHGVAHGYYMDGVDNHDTSDYYYNIKKVRYMVDESEIRNRLDHFFGLLDYYKINKKVSGMVPPSGAYRVDELSYILRDYGIKYTSTPFRFLKKEECDYIYIEQSGVIAIDRPHDALEWNEYNADYDSLPERCGHYGAHWPNFLHIDPEKNMEIVDRAIEYFKRCAENIGCVISKDMRFAITQSFYYKFAQTNEVDGGIEINLAKVPVHSEINDVFYVNSAQPIREYRGCEIKEYARKKDFITYEIKPFGKSIFLG
ncbi:MAG: hypothetical protein IKU45_02230 [Clostridia bacterium]|nr:hypothetical protein [Clostridia bacterium]